MALLGLAWGTPCLAAQQDDVALARRIAAMSAVALEEYALGVEDGGIVSRAEYDEAETFLQEVRRRSGDLSPAVREFTAATIEELLAGVAARRDVGALRVVLDTLRRRLERTLGAGLDPLPAAPPSLARGARVFQLHCIECHGARGAGDGPKAARLDPPPADFTDRDALRGTSPLDFFRKISVGVSGTEMKDWEGLLPLEDRWAAALYVTGFRYADQDHVAGEQLLRSRCPDCLPLLGDLGETAGMSDDSLRAVLAGRMGSEPPDLVLGYARTAAAAEAFGGDREVELARTMAKTADGVARAVALAGAGARADAASAALDAYLVFERIETPLRARDARAARAVETAFSGLRATVATGSPERIEAARREVQSTLARAQEVLTAESRAGELFGQSFVIMVREGLEAILIIGALMAFLTKAGAPERRREISWGVGAALVASLATAGVLATVYRQSVTHREALEGVTMLVAAAVLFSVSYWLVSKIEVKKWHAFVGSQIRRALSSGRALALALVAFLAVYREGFETVLFYGALFATGRGTVGSAPAITAGMALGFVVLAAVYYAIVRWGVRLPLKPFFGVTSALLYLMAFSFAGQGIAELQVAGWIGATPIRWVPSVPALGIFPTWQTLAIQLALALAVLGALAWVFWLEPRTVRAEAGR